MSYFGGYMVNYARSVYNKTAFTVELCPYYSTYPYSDYTAFANTVNSVLPIGLLMAEAVMNMEQDNEAIDLTIDDKLVIFTDIRPTIINDRTLVPLRAACEAIGLQVGWDAQTSQITVTNGEKVVGLTIGSDVMTIDGEEITLDTAPCIISERTMMPIRAVVEAFGYKVGWDAATRTVLIDKIAEIPLPDDVGPGDVEDDADVVPDTEVTEEEQLPENDVVESDVSNDEESTSTEIDSSELQENEYQ